MLKNWPLWLKRFIGRIPTGGVDYDSSGIAHVYTREGRVRIPDSDMDRVISEYLERRPGPPTFSDGGHPGGGPSD